jgi:hypothetical protein
MIKKLRNQPYAPKWEQVEDKEKNVPAEMNKHAIEELAFLCNGGVNTPLQHK